MAILLYPIAIVRQRRNPARIRHYNARIVQGEDVHLAISIYNYDTDTGPKDVTGSAPVLTLFRDRMNGGHEWYGWSDYGQGYNLDATAVLQVYGTVATAGPNAGTQIDIFLTSAQTAPLGGRYRFYLYNDTNNGVTTLAEGILQVEGCAWASPGLLGTQTGGLLDGNYLAPDGSPDGFFYAPDAALPSQVLVPNMISVTPIPAQLSGQSFGVAGLLGNYNAPPTLTYADNEGAFQSLPAGASVSQVGFSFLHPPLTAGIYTLMVSDGTNSVVSNSFLVVDPANTASGVTLPTDLPTVPGVLWNNGGVLSSRKNCGRFGGVI